MLIYVMANNVMLSKTIQRSQLLINNLKAFNITDYCFELSPHDFGGPPPLYVHQHQLEENNEKKTILDDISHPLLQELQEQEKHNLNYHRNINITTNTYSVITNTNNDDKS